MSQITINTLTGVPPYDIYVCDINQITCVLSLSAVTTAPVSVPIPSIFNNSPLIIIKIIDAASCEITNTFSCVTPSPTPTLTQTPTVTPSITTSPSPTPSITPSSQTPTPTPSFSPTPSITPSLTPTITPTPSTAFRIKGIFLFIEPYSGASSIASYMGGFGLSFSGFTNGTFPSTTQVNFETEMNKYMDFFFNNLNIGTVVRYPKNRMTGVNPIVWLNRYFTVLKTGFNDTIVNSDSEWFDNIGNKIHDNNLQTLIVSAGTINQPAWYTLFVPTAYTENYIQKNIGVSYGDPNKFTDVVMEPNIYSLPFNYTGIHFENIGYRVYTCFPSSEFLINNSSTNIYFKGSFLSI